MGSYSTSLRRLSRPEPAAFMSALFVAHANYNLSSFGIPRMDFSGIGSFSPAPCSPPLGGSDETSAVRFTPAKSRAGAKTGRPDAKLDV